MPRRRRRSWGLPLLMKELTEQSARKRTFVVRTLYAALLFATATLIFWASVYQNVTSPLQVLGRGREMFTAIIGLQIAGIYLFMPAITCGVLTFEKERNTLSLLLLTRLGPWAILLEKLLSRLIPMGTFLLLSLPLLGFSYAMGGVSQSELWIGVWALALTTLQVGAFALACSAWFRTTVQAFIATYLLGLMLYFGPVILGELTASGREAAEILAEYYGHIATSYAATIAGAFQFLTTGNRWLETPLDPLDIPTPQFIGLLMPPVALLDRTPMAAWHAIPLSLPALLTVGMFLVAARVCIVRRAFVPASNLLLKAFHVLDRVFVRLNQNRVTRGIVLINESATLPEDDPVAWRETKKRSLGTTRYLIRLFVATELPVLMICTLITFGGGGTASAKLEAVGTVFIFLGWVCALLLLCVKSAVLVAGERSHETLSVLLSTPIAAEDLLRQKFRGVQRLMLVLACPLVTMMLFEASWREAVTPLGSPLGYPTHPVLYLTASLLTVAIYFPLTAWISFHIGLRTRSPARAIFTSLAVIAGWCLIPFAIVVTVHEIVFPVGSANSPLNLTMLFSPAMFPILVQFADLDDLFNAPWLATLLNSCGYGLILMNVRRHTLRNAAHYLDRAESPSPTATPRIGAAFQLTGSVRRPDRPVSTAP